MPNNLPSLFDAADREPRANPGRHFDAMTMIELVEHLAAADAARLFAEARELLSADRYADAPDDTQLPLALAHHR